MVFPEKVEHLGYKERCPTQQGFSMLKSIAVSNSVTLITVAIERQRPSIAL